MRHLSDEEFIDLMDDALPAERREHLWSCDACRAQATELDHTLTRAIHAGPIPEPSPLFWDHLSARVRDAVAVPQPTSWRDYIRWPRPAWTAGLASIALAVAVTHSMLPRAPMPTGAPAGLLRTSAGPVAGGTEPTDDIETDEAWAVVQSVADQVAWDEARDAGISTRPDAAEGMTFELSTREQSELVRLLRSELPAGARW